MSKVYKNYIYEYENDKEEITHLPYYLYLFLVVRK
jgi:hypothetical protein